MKKRCMEIKKDNPDYLCKLSHNHKGPHRYANPRISGIQRIQGQRLMRRMPKENVMDYLRHLGEQRILIHNFLTEEEMRLESVIEAAQKRLTEVQRLLGMIE